MSEGTETVINEAIQSAEPVRDPLDDLVEKSKADPSAPFESVAVTQIIALKKENPAAFERWRIRLKDTDVRLGELDKLLAAKAGESKETSGQGQSLSLPEPEPWHEPVNGAALLDGLAAMIRQHVVLAKSMADAIALWIVHTYLFTVLFITPRLGIISPVKQCGKTTLLDILANLCQRPMLTANITAAAVFRTVELAQPTLLIDEADTFAKDKDDLRGILNSGYRQGGSVTRTVGENHDVRMFSTWSPAAIAMIGKQLPDTLEDRSIPIRLRRRRKDEPITQFRADRTGNLHKLARMAARWAEDNRDKLAAADPDMPEYLFNRVADNWRPLIAIADAAGGGWPKRARDVAGELSGGSDAGQSQLLADIHTIFTDRNTDRLPSATLAGALAAMEGSPWGEMRGGKPITQNTLARMLDTFHIKPGSIRIGGETPKGYMREQFSDAWGRYLSPDSSRQSATPPQAVENLDAGVSFEAQQHEECGGLETPEGTRETAICGGVADESASIREREHAPDST